ncbi:MAG: alpha-galactosidase, partial [Verrucomicrobia bacterium]
LRAVEPEAIVTIDGRRYEVGGLKGQRDRAFLLAGELDRLRADPAALRLSGWSVGPATERLAWKRVRHHAPDVRWPPAGVHLRLDFEPPADAKAAFRVSVHYELYDGIPAFCKWITVENLGDRPLRVDHFVSERLAVVEEFNWVETRDGVPLPRPTALHVETDYAFGGFQPANANRHIVHWRPDPEFKTQVNYRLQQPCLLEVEPPEGPAQVVEPGGTFTSCRAFELLHDSTERERRGLALRRLYRTVAPWITENPLMMHLRRADEASVRRAIDQCAEVGFEMLILSFGSGFNLEANDPAVRQRWKRLADEAHARGIEIGGYSLLASRHISAEDDVLMPPGQKPTFGHSPCLGSRWGTNYFGKLYRFFEETGFDLLEHDGSYPGDVCLSTNHPGHAGFEDSRWNQWRIITDFYRWCRGRGIYLNVPDFYFLAGSTKTGMGYREVNWSLPRDLQVIHTRQNIYDGTWQKTPSMGWMFVPLTEYHGGGAAATIEPLEEHLDHYRRMLQSNLAFGVQACYRGPRLYDTGRTRDMVRRQVAWFKQYRDILESDLIHGRRADGRDVDWMLHVNPRLAIKGMLVVFNPLPEPVERLLRVNLYYTGLTDTARVREQDGPAREFTFARDHTIRLPVRVPARGMNWCVIE